MIHLAPVLGAALVLAIPATALAQAPAGPPGPPPGNGTDLPSAPGTAPPAVPPGSPATIPAGAPGPGLLSGAPVSFNRAKRGFLLPIACQGNGTISFTARAAARGTLGKTRYRCAGNRSRPRLTVTRKVARKILRKKNIGARATIKQAGKTAKIDFVLHVKGSTPAADFWTDGHLLCSPDGGATPQAFLAEPDFTTQNPTPISTRAWVAWYTNAGGWHWLGTKGENSSAWEAWTALSYGVQQFHPNGGPGQPTPLTWGPISVPLGQGTYAIGVYELVYWVGGAPDWHWQYVNAGTTGAAAAGAAKTPYCTYP